jgi:hypothetical protein
MHGGPRRLAIHLINLFPYFFYPELHADRRGDLMTDMSTDLLVSRSDSTHAKLLDCAVQVRLEPFDLSLVCRNTKYVLALGANESFDRVKLPGRGGIQKTRLDSRLDLQECAARSGQAEEYI